MHPFRRAGVIRAAMPLLQRTIDDGNDQHKNDNDSNYSVNVNAGEDDVERVMLYNHATLVMDAAALYGNMCMH